MTISNARVRDPGFSVAALVGFFARALAAQDEALLPSDFRLADLRDTRTSIASEKRRLANHALEVGGPAVLLAVGQRLAEVRDHPNIAVLLGTADPAVLAYRWMRLERAHHSPHIIDIKVDGDHAWNCTHNARGEMPSPAESLCACGILAGLLELIGAEDTRISFGEERIPSEVIVSGGFADAPPVDRFRISWAGIDSSAHNAPASSPHADSQADAPGLEEQLLALFREEPARGWRLADVSERLALSTRSVQRRLTDTGYSFDTLLREARVAEAALLIRTTDHTLEFIAHRAGFSDQPHFQREFARVLDVTPAIYREVGRAQ